MLKLIKRREILININIITVNGEQVRYKSSYWTEGGVFLQGDNARLHDDGSYTFHGRSDEVININGVRIGTEEIEAQVWAVAAGKLKCTGVAVVGAPDHIKGTTPVAFVVFDKATKENLAGLVKALVNNNRLLFKL